jgi:tetratricopeptide (TPR) repeat protein
MNSSPSRPAMHGVAGSRALPILAAAAILGWPARGQPQAQPPPSTDSQLMAPATNPPPPLPKEVADEVARLEPAIDAALVQPDKVELTTDAIPKAERILNLRLAHQGATWWEPAAAHQRLSDLKRLASMPSEQRARLAEARRLIRRMFQFRREGNCSNALELAERACEIRGEVLGQEHPDYAVSLNNVAFCLNALPGRQLEALEKYEAALATFRRQFLGDHPTTATFLNNVAYCLNELPDRLSESLPKYQAALEMQQRLFTGDHADVALSLNNVAACLEDLGRPAEALPRHEAALAMRQRLFQGDHEDVATSLNNLATCLKALACPAEALPKFEAAFAMYRRLFQRDHHLVATGLDNLAACLDDLGRSAEALPRYEAALAMRQRLFRHDHWDTALSLNNTAYCLQTLGRLSEALPKYEAALAMRQRLYTNDYPAVASSLNNVGGCLRALQRLPEALQKFEAALSMQQRLFPADHPDRARSLNNVASCLDGLGRPAEAAAKYEAALAMRRRLYAGDHPDIARSLNDLAGVRAALGQGEEAARLLLESAQVLWRHLTRNFTALSAQQKSRLLRHAQFDPSQRLLSLSFQSNAVAGNAGLRGVLLSKQLLFEAARQENGALLATAAAAPAAWSVKWQEREQLRRQYATLALQSLVEARGQPSPERLKADLDYVRSLSDRIEQLEQDLRLGNPAYDRAARLQEVRLEDVANALRPGEALLEYARYRPDNGKTNGAAPDCYGAFILPGGTSTVVAVGLGKADTIDEAVRRFRAELGKVIVPFRDGVQPSDTQLRRSEEQLALVSSALRERVWKPLETQLSGVRRVYVAPDGWLSLVPFEALARKSEPDGWRYLAEEREFVYLGTGRDLARLAMGANASTIRPLTAVLVGNPAFSAAPQELAAVVAGMTPAATTLAQLDLGADASTLGATTPATTKRAHVPKDWQQILALERLIGQVGQQLDRLGWSVTVLTNQWAVEEAVLRLNAPRLLQFATHGYILDRPETGPESWDNPLLHSMLLMAGVNRWQADRAVFYRTGGELLTVHQARGKGLSPEQLAASRVGVADGLLTAYEVTGMNLQGTELVNLTACDTGLGEVTPDGVVGLRQAFLLAGARSLTLSVWEVPAAETTRQISDFYTRWLTADAEAKPDPITLRYHAFRAAQLAALAHARETHGTAHPLYWAGVVYVGDPGDLPTSPANSQ